MPQAERIWRARGDAAGVSRALHGQASVYLDTVRPVQAESLLQEALGLAEGIANREARARLLELLAENKLNIGKPADAEVLRAEAQALRDAGPAEDVLSLRVKLRTGQLAEARRLLEARAESERRAARAGQVARRAPTARPCCCSHSSARSRAGPNQQWRSPARASPWASAWPPLSWRRWATCGWDTRGSCDRCSYSSSPAADDWTQPRAEAIRCYETAIALGDQLDVRRTRAEAMWGLTRAYGFFTPSKAIPAATWSPLSARPAKGSGSPVGPVTPGLPPSPN